jgi:Na+-translocating ferredoxin:NAD+ oxidoreductase subunit G
MRDMIKMGLILLLITSISGLVLGVTNSLTEDIILQRALEGDMASMQALIPDVDTYEPVDVSGVDIPGINLVGDVYAGITDGAPVGYIINVSPTGYGGAIEMMVGINVGHEIAGVEILTHTETPGLGSVVANEEFRNQYSGLTTDGSVAVDTISGATASSSAVNHGVSVAAALYEETLRNQ